MTLTDIVRGREVPTLDVDPYSDTAVEDPYSFYETLREAAPVVYIPKYDCYAVGRYEETARVASDYECFTSTGGIGLTDIRKPGHLRPRSPITEVDPPEHTAARKALMRIMSPKVLRDWREVLTTEGEALAEKLIQQGEFDGVRDVAEAFVLTVIPRLVGLDIPAENLIITGELNFNQMGPANERLKQSVERAEPYMEWYNHALKRENMLPGGFGEQIYLAEDAGEFPPGTASLHVRSFFRAGVDTTIASIEYTLKHLAQNPEAYQKIHEDPTKIKGAFEEALRLDSPVMVLWRVVKNDMELSGYALEGDKKIGYFMGAANRDPRKWSNPDTFDIERKTAGVHLAFGHGIHTCVAQMIARMEAECALGPLARKARKLELTAAPTIRYVNTLRTLDALPLRATPT
ncbi:cytochrome P450 [Pseudochelatococcus sp. B33]